MSGAANNNASQQRVSLTHGGDIQGFVDEYGFEPLDFSANVSPLGLPPAVSQAIVECIPSLAAYPDPLCRRLNEALAAHHGIGSEQVLCGNGCSDLIYRLAAVLRPAQALLCAPTFAEYEAALEPLGCTFSYYDLLPQKGYVVGEDFLEAITPSVQMVFICQPNNPTGRTVSRSLLQRILQRCNQVGAWLVVDECFIEFLDDPAAITMEGQLSPENNLIILKAFTKLYGMAGLRLGYLMCADADLICRLRSAAQPWAVSSLAQAAGVAALSSEDYVDALRALIKQERSFLTQELLHLGISAQGEANFLFFSLDDGGALTGRLRQKGVLVRDCSNYHGLQPGHYRIAVRGHEENSKFIAALRGVLEEA